MAGRWGDASAFRADPATAPPTRPSARQTIGLLAVLLLVCGAVAVASYVVRPDRARAFQLFHGSLFLSDLQSPVAVDLASGRPTLRLVGADKQVSVTASEGLAVVPLDSGTLLLNRRTGEFNMVDTSGFVVKHDGGGVPLGRASGDTSAIGVAAGDLAYVIRNSADRSDVFLVSQATVTEATSATTAVRPRASTALPGLSFDTGPGGAVAADSALWALVTDRAGRQGVRRLSYPADSNAGVRLAVANSGTVAAPSALGTVGGSSASAVAVASADRIRMLTGSKRIVRFNAPANVDSILPATSAEGRLAFLLHGTGGWSLVSVRPDGTGLRGPHTLADVPAGAALAQPAYSAGSLYTVARDSGAVYRVDADASTHRIAQYPLARVGGVTAELASMPDGYVVARGARVVVNSATHSNALMLFTDGSHAPRRIEKGSAVGVSAAGGAEQLAKSTANPPQAPGHNGPNPPTRPRPTQNEVVNPHLDCADAMQKPHIPIVGGIQAGSRSVTLNWTYPIIDRTQDCFPTTYTVDVELLSANAPQPPGTVRVESQVGATITGLFPESRYRMRVTAYIHQQGTSSDWFQVRTGPEGPAAPTGVTVAADNAGNWSLGWSSCGAVDQGCVPVQSWTVTPSFCDGRGLSAPPTAKTAPADPTSRRQPPFTYAGGDALLGRGLQFVITGSGATQVQGTPSVRTPCVTSWSPPDAGAMTLAASRPANSSFGNTTSTTVRLDLAGNPTRDLGGVGATVEFRLAGPDGTRSTAVTYSGTGTSLTTTFDGLRPGVEYRATAVVRPPGHPDAAVTLGPQTVTAAADWPNVGLTADCVPQGPIVQITCGFTARIGGISSAALGGETFDIVNTGDTQSAVVCGSHSKNLARDGIDPANPITDTLSLLFGFSGSCTVTLVLRENGSVFGGTLKTVSAQYSAGQATTYAAKSGDFSVQWDRSKSDSEAHVAYQGDAYTVDQLAQITQSWTVTVRGPDGQSCGTRSFDSPPNDVDVPATGSCVDQFGDRPGWAVDITYQDAGTGNEHSVPGNHGLDGPPPGYQPCAPGTIGASWTGTAAAPAIAVTVPGTLTGCHNWTYQVLDPAGQDCPAQSDGTPDSVTLTISCATPPSQNDWTVRVSWHDPADAPHTADVRVDGNVPG